MKNKHDKLMRILWIVGIIFALSIIFVSQFFRERAQIRHLVNEGAAQYVQSAVTKYEAELREWTDDDARALLGGGEDIEKTVQYPEFEDGDGIPADIEAQPLILFSNNSDEEVALFNEGFTYSDKNITGRWMPLLYYADIEYWHWAGDANAEPFFKSIEQSSAIRMVKEKMESIGMTVDMPSVAINMTEDAISKAKKAVFSDTGTLPDENIDNYIFIEFQQMKDSIPFFIDYRETNYACPPGYSVTIGDERIWDMTVYGEYVNFNRTTDYSDVLTIDELLDLLSDRIVRTLRSAQSVRLQYVVLPIKDKNKYEVIPCWSFYSVEGQLLFDINAIDGTLV